MTSQRNEGEGNRTAAKAYNDKATAFAQSGQVEDKARAAAKALDDPQARAEMKAAEQEGKAHAHGEDPAIARALENLRKPNYKSS